MVELIVNGSKIELPKGTNIKYTKQISDIFDIANVACSYTTAFEFEPTPNNTQAMQQLGISGDSSQIPYKKNTSQLKVNGFDLISKGWFNIQSKSDNYKGSIINGMIDFFKAIENKTMGNDLDLSNFNHEKNLSTVVASFTNDYYQYIIADYGGKNIFENGINIDYLAPCFSVRKLWELIFSTFGFNCDYTNLGYINGLYITYPKDVAEGQLNELISSLNRTAYVSQQISNVGGISQPVQFYSWSSSTITEGELVNNWKFRIPETSSYNFDLAIEMYVIYRRPQYKNENVDVQIEVLKNGIVIGSIISNFQAGTDGTERTLNFNQSCIQGDIIELKIWAPSGLSFRGRDYRSYEWRHNNTDFKISKTDLGTVTLENELKDFLIKDFIKEQIWRTGLTPVLNVETNTVEFKTLDSRLDFNNAQDLSACYVRRKDEFYQNDYAQKNTFRLKHNIESDSTGNGYLYVPNQNLDDEKVLAESKIYAPDTKIVTEFFGFSTNQYKIWEIEIKDNDNVAEINYKGLSGRFYFLRKDIINGSFKIISEKLNDETTVSSLPYAINNNTLFEEAIYNNYSEYQKIFNNFRIHPIELILTENDFIGVDLTRPVFFKQENAFYMCDKISFQEGPDGNEGTFIKINKL